MRTRRLFLGIVCAAILALIPTAVPAWSTQTNYLKFNAPVALPGVTLAPGTYTFCLPSDMDRNVVQVLDGKQTRVYYMGLTQPVQRPNGDPNRMVIMGEALPGQATPIRA